MVESASAKITEGNGSLWISGTETAERGAGGRCWRSQAEFDRSPDLQQSEAHQDRIFNGICIIARPDRPV
jgi:GT2 family glycosyltransferase